MLKELKEEVKKIGKPEWQPLLKYVADLHANSIHAPFFKLPYQWEEIAPNGNLGVIFGNWDSVHIALDTLFLEPKHALRQILNSLALQDDNGVIPGHISVVNNEMRWNKHTTFPPLWPFVIQDYFDLTNNYDHLSSSYEALEKQLQWFESNRKTGPGFYYVDHLDHLWESGIENGVRLDFGVELDEEMICIDATSHVYNLYIHAAKWAQYLNKEIGLWIEKADQVRELIQHQLFDEETGFFHDQWMIGNPAKRIFTFEGMWPLVAGAATFSQAQRVINENLLDTGKFFTSHPIPAVGIQEPRFEYCHWRGPTRNSMSYWAARGCMRYDRFDAASALLEKALDSTAEQFKLTGKIWEFYHPEGGDPRELSRNHGAVSSTPEKDYLGHNPLIAMAILWKEASLKC